MPRFILLHSVIIRNVRGCASKSAHSPVIRCLIDWLSTRVCLKVCALWKSILPGNKPTKLGQLQPIYGHSDYPSYETKVKTESKMVSYKKWKKNYKQRPPNQSINHRITYECTDFAAKTGCADFETCPCIVYSIFFHRSASPLNDTLHLLHSVCDVTQKLLRQVTIIITRRWLKILLNF